MNLEQGETVENVVYLEKKKTWYESMSYDELLNERNFMRKERTRVRAARRSCNKIDPRGMWSETHEIDKLLLDMIRCCDTVIQWLEKEMFSRIKKDMSDHD